MDEHIQPVQCPKCGSFHLEGRYDKGGDSSLLSDVI